MLDPNKPEPAPHGSGREIVPLVIKDLELRSKMGKEKYGETLRAFNGRNPLVDLYQELLDAVQYIRQAIEEQRYINLEATFERVKTDALISEPLQGVGDRMTAREFLVQRQMKEAESVAQEAHRLVLGDRGEAYGHPIFDMSRTADMVTALLRHKLRPGARLEAEDIGQVMIAVKQSRHQNKPKRDNEVDIAGYALCLEMIAEWRRGNPGVDPRDVFPES
jgi:hypothetical protein